MKRTAFLVITASLCAFGQTTTRFDVLTDHMELRNLNSTQYFTITNSGNATSDPGIVPSSGSWGMLGTVAKPIWEVNTNHIYTGSDERIKEEIKDLDDENVLGKIAKVRTVSYKLKEVNGKKSTSREIGFLAQNLNESFPELVRHDVKSDMYQVDYTRTVAVLLSAIKQQQKIIDQQGSEIDSMKKKLGM
jgi:hypothetical protein